MELLIPNQVFCPQHRRIELRNESARARSTHRREARRDDGGIGITPKHGYTALVEAVHRMYPMTWHVKLAMALAPDDRSRSVDPAGQYVPSYSPAVTFAVAHV